jgi:hypothetical protein
LIRILALFFLLLFLPHAALAHKPSDSYLVLQASGAHIDGQWDIALRDLEHAIGLDADGDGAITWGELKAQHTVIADYAMSRLKLRTENRDCDTKATDHLVDTHSDGAYAVLRFEALCPASGALDIDYRLFFDLDPSHRGLLRWQSGELATTGVFSPERRVIRVEGNKITRLTQFLDYGREGVWHIWIGIDHILFLISLLLPAVLVAAGRTWLPVERFGPALWDVLKVVTSFTVAHSITLSLAALSIIDLPARVTETAIALSVFLAALNNIWPVVRGRRWIVAFAFGLIHGFGFASVLADLGLPQDTLLTALIGFNLGVEAGQLAVVAVFLPCAYAMRRTALYRRAILVGGSALIAAVAAAWVAERWFDLKLFG